MLDDAGLLEEITIGLLDDAGTTTLDGAELLEEAGLLNDTGTVDGTVPLDESKTFDELDELEESGAHVREPVPYKDPFCS